MEEYNYHKRDKLWYLEIYRFEDIKKFISLVGDKLVIKKPQVEKLVRILEIVDKKLHLSPEGLTLIRAIWRAPKTGVNPPIGGGLWKDPPLKVVYGDAPYTSPRMGLRPIRLLAG